MGGCRGPDETDGCQLVRKLPDRRSPQAGPVSACTQPSGTKQLRLGGPAETGTVTGPLGQCHSAGVW